MSINLKYFFAFGLLILAFQSFGQAARSPFSSLMSIGEPYGNALINAQGMGGVGVSQPQFWYLNNQNPALLVYNTLTVFQAGIIGETRMVRNDTASERNVGGNMNYLATAFPIKPTKWTTSLGLMPYSTLNYRIQYVDFVRPTLEEINVSEEGQGGLTQFYWSNGVRLHKNIAIGMKASYIFSSLVNTYTNRLVESSQPINYPVTIEEKTYVKDFAFSTGLSFSKDSLFNQNRYRFSVGAVYNFGANLNTEQRFSLFRSSAVGDVIDPDTLYTNNGSILIPPSITAGISLSRSSKWTIGTEFTYQDWSAFRNTEGSNENLGQSWKVGLGGEITPDLLSENFFQRIQYRTGLSMEQYPFTTFTPSGTRNTVKDIGINFGFSMPAGRSSIDWAFKYGRRGNRADNILEESYFKIYFGITFNDQWFIQRKFD